MRGNKKPHAVDLEKFVKTSSQLSLPKDNSSHNIEIVDKISKTTGKKSSIWYKKYIHESYHRKAALQEEYYQELFRLLDPLQPKTRAAFSKNGTTYVLSRAIDGFTTFHELLKKKKQETLDHLSTGVISNLGSVCGNFLLGNQIDLKTPNYGEDSKHRALQVDGGWCGARLRIRECLARDKFWGEMPADAKFNITEDVLRKMPALHTLDYTTYNFGEQIYKKNRSSSNQLLDNIKLEPFRLELNINLLKQILTPTKYFKALALHHAETDEEKSAMTTEYIETANRRLQTFVAALSNQSFRDFVLSEQAEKIIEQFDDYLHKDGKGHFKMAGKTPLWANTNDATFMLDLLLLRGIAEKPVNSAEWHELVQKVLISFIREIPANEYGETPLHLAALADNVLITRAALACSQSIDLNALTTFHDTALILAIENKNFNAARELLTQNNIDVTICKKNGVSPLRLAFDRMRHDLCYTIITRYPQHHDFSEIEPRILDALMNGAIKENHTEAIRRLLLNPHIKNGLLDHRHDNHFYTAARHANPAAFKLIIDALSANNLRPKPLVWTNILRHAIRDGKLGILDQMLDHPCKPDLPPHLLDELLIYASTTKHVDVVKYLVAKGANINAVPPTFIHPPIIYAAKNGCWEVVEFLAAQPGCNVNVTNAKTKQTALHRAAKYGALNTVRVLLDHQADHTLKNTQGRTAYDCADGAMKKEIQALLAAKSDSEIPDTSALKTSGLHATSVLDVTSSNANSKQNKH